MTTGIRIGGDLFEKTALSSIGSLISMSTLNFGSTGSTTIKMPISMTKGETEFDIRFARRKLRGKKKRVGSIHNMCANICYE